MGRNTGGNPGDVRKSALWGSGNRGGEHRSNALWGKGGRGFVTTVLVVALAVPLAAGAGSGSGQERRVVPPGATYVSAELKEMQRTHPNEMVDVIVQTDDTVSDKDAKKAEHELKKLGRRFDLIKGFAGQIRAKDLEKLAKYKGLIVTEDAAIRPQELLPTVVRRRADVIAAVDVPDRYEQAVDERQVGDDRDRRLGHRRLARGLQGTRQGAGQLRHLGVPERGRRRSRSRHVRRGYRGGQRARDTPVQPRTRTSSRSTSWTTVAPARRAT